MSFSEFTFAALSDEPKRLAYLPDAPEPLTLEACRKQAREIRLDELSSLAYGYREAMQSDDNEFEPLDILFDAAPPEVQRAAWFSLARSIACDDREDQIAQFWVIFADLWLCQCLDVRAESLLAFHRLTTNGSGRPNFRSRRNRFNGDDVGADESRDSSDDDHEFDVESDAIDGSDDFADDHEPEDPRNAVDQAHELAEALAAGRDGNG